MFTKENYPKSYASIQKHDYRLKDFLNLPEKELENLQHALWKIVDEKVKLWDVRKEFEGLEYLDSGWEMSVFKLNDQSVLKIPNGMFIEVGSKQYFKNIEFSYNQIKSLIPNKFIVPIEVDSENFRIKQQFLDGKYFNVYRKEELSTYLKEQLNTLIESMIKCFLEFHYNPFKFQLSNDMDFYVSYNIMKDSEEHLYINDYSDYYDIFKLYPQRTKVEVERCFEITKKMIRDLDLDTKLIGELSLANLKIQSELDEYIKQL